MQRVYSLVEYFCFFCCFSIIAFFAILSALSFLCKGSAQHGKQVSCLCVSICGGYENDIHSSDLIDLIIINLREYELLLQSQRVVAAA